MSGSVKIAWRDIWRNKRRTLITAASIFLAIFLALMMRSMQIGTYAHMIDNIVHAYTGYIQVHRQGYWNEKDINNSFPWSDTLASRIKAVTNVKTVAPRLESFALASSGPKTKGILVIGIDPFAENAITGAGERVVSGSYLTPSDSGVLIARRLANYLGLKTGDTLVLIGQGYHGASAAGKFPVRGLVTFPSPDLDKQVVYLSLQAAQDFYSAGQNITSIAIDLKNRKKVSQAASRLEKVLDPGKYEVMRWDQMMVEVMQHIRTDNVSGMIMLGILYMIIGFGIFGTVLMMTLERIREFGVMVAVGMQKAKLSLIVLLETIFIGLLGILSGAAASIPLIFYFMYHPISFGGEIAKTTEVYGYEALICFEPPSTYFLANSLLVMAVVLLAATYPIRKIARMQVINALRNKI